MTLPLPRVIPDTGPGGGIVTSMRGMNALNNEIQDTKINAVRAQYAPLTNMAEAASKLAYSNLVGPQYVSKLMSNQDILANMSPEQRQQALQMIVGAGIGQQRQNPIDSFSNMNQGPQQSSNLSNLVDKIKNAFGFNQKSFTPENNNALLQNISNLSQPENNNALLKNRSNLSQVDKNSINHPQPEQFYTSPNQNIQNEEIPDDFFVRSGKAAGAKAQETKLGAIRAATINDLDQQYQQAVQAEAPIDNLIKITQDPIFMNMRNKIPFFQDKQLKFLSKTGTPQEQKIIGDFTTSATNAVANTINGFRGRILDKEISMANQMKISPDDTWNTMIGKLASIETFNQLVKQRSRLASQFVEKDQLNRGAAIEKADKMIDADKIRNSVEERLNTKQNITDEDIEHTAKKHNISTDEVRKRLKQEGRL